MKKASILASIENDIRKKTNSSKISKKEKGGESSKKDKGEKKEQKKINAALIYTMKPYLTKDFPPKAFYLARADKQKTAVRFKRRPFEENQDYSDDV